MIWGRGASIYEVLTEEGGVKNYPKYADYKYKNLADRGGVGRESKIPKYLWTS